MCASTAILCQRYSRTSFRAASASASPSPARWSPKPALLLCDEILSALDVSVQANILTLLQRLKSEHGIAMLFISHDLAVVRLLADRVGVLFGGELMEIGPRDQVFAPPFHPYTHSLLDAVPDRRCGRPIRKPACHRPASRNGVEQGCVYAGRCPGRSAPSARTSAPPWRETLAALSYSLPSSRSTN